MLGEVCKSPCDSHRMTAKKMFHHVHLDKFNKFHPSADGLCSFGFAIRKFYITFDYLYFRITNPKERRYNRAVAGGIHKVNYHRLHCKGEIAKTSG